MSKIKSLLTINKSKGTAVKIETIEDLKQVLEQDIATREKKEKTSIIITDAIIIAVVFVAICI